LEIECRIVSKLAVQNGTSARGPWAKQEFVVEYQDGNYPNKVCMSVWGQDKVNDLDRYNVGDQIKASLTLSSREFNGRWYTDIRAWRIEPASAAAPAAPAGYAAAPAASAAPADSVPAGFAPRTAAPSAPAAPAAPAPSAADIADFSDDDMPF